MTPRADRNTQHPGIHPVTLQLPGLPQALESLRAVHLTDLHIHRPRRRHDLLAELLGAMEVDLVLMTGDYMSTPGDEPAAEAVMRRLCTALKPRHGIFGVYGNHDTPDLRHRLADLPVRWLHNQTHRLTDLPVEITGMETLRHVHPDSLAMLHHQRQTKADHPQGDARDASQSRPLKLMLCHHPTYLPAAADLGMDVMLSGHTHGGQCRLPGKRALLNSTDLPMHLTSGVLRHRDTLGLVSRGLGEVHLPLRLFCPPHVPVYTFEHGPLMGDASYHIHNTQPW